MPTDQKLEKFRLLLKNGTRNRKSGEWIDGLMREKNLLQELNIPYEHQWHAIIDMMPSRVEFFGLFHNMGLGKTVTGTLLVAAERLCTGYTPKTLVTCPAPLVNHWKKDMLNWLRVTEAWQFEGWGKSHPNWGCSKLLAVSSSEQLTPEYLNAADIVIVSREIVTRAFTSCYHKEERAEQVDTPHGRRWVSAWRRKPIAEGDDRLVPLHALYGAGFTNELNEETGEMQRVEVNRKYDLLIADESHEYRSMASVRTHAHRALSERSIKRIACTGTPILHRTSDIASQCYAFMCPKVRDPDCKAEEEENYKYVDFQKASTWNMVGDYNTLNEKTNLLFKKFVNRSSADTLNLPPLMQTAVSYDVNIDPEHVERYNSRIKQARQIRECFQHNPEAVTKKDVTRLLKLLQRSQFEVISPLLGEYGAKDYHEDDALQEDASVSTTGALTALLNEVQSLQREGHKRIVISSMHTCILHLAARFLAREAPESGKQYFYDGSLSPVQREKQKIEFLACRVGLCFLSIAAGGQGVHMVPGCEAMILFGSTPWSNAQVDQVIKRIHRMGQTCPTTGSVQIRRLVPYGSVDAAISAVHGCKRRLQKMTVDMWGDATEARKRKRGSQDDESDDDDGDITDANAARKWRRTSKVVDGCKLLMECGNFPEMPLNTFKKDTEEVTGMFTVVPGVQTRYREGELADDAIESVEPEQPPAAEGADLGPMGMDADQAAFFLQMIGPVDNLPPPVQAQVQQMMGNPAVQEAQQALA